jgi:hypothetical protein
MSGFFSEMFSPKHLGSGGLTFINDGLLKATGMGNNTTLGALNDAAQHGPLEESLAKGRPVTYTEATNERGNRLGQDGSGNAKTIANIAGLVGMMFGGAAAGGAMGGAGSAGAGTSAGAGATTGASTSAAGAGYSGAASNAAFDSAMAGSSGAGTSAAGSSGGLLSYVKPVGEAASSANQVRGLLGADGQPVQSHAPDQGNGQGAQTLAQLYQQGLIPTGQQRRTNWG